MISSSQRPLPDNTQHSQQTNIHAPCGIRTHELSRRAAADLCLRPRDHWGPAISITLNNILCAHNKLVYLSYSVLTVRNYSLQRLEYGQICNSSLSLSLSLYLSLYIYIYRERERFIFIFMKIFKIRFPNLIIPSFLCHGISDFINILEFWQEVVKIRRSINMNCVKKC